MNECIRLASSARYTGRASKFKKFYLENQLIRMNIQAVLTDIYTNSINDGDLSMNDTSAGAGFFSIIEFVKLHAPDDIDFSDDDFYVLLDISRKLEISRSLYDLYEMPAMRPASTSHPVTTRVVNALLVVFIFAYIHYGDLRFLNTVYKTLTYGLFEPDYLPGNRELLSIADTLLWKP